MNNVLTCFSPISKGKDVNNPIAADRLNYDVLFHTDLSRSSGTSNGLDLDRLNWGNYDLVVIDESHNFRNGAGTHANTQENRYIEKLFFHFFFCSFLPKFCSFSEFIRTPIELSDIEVAQIDGCRNLC